MNIGELERLAREALAHSEAIGEDDWYSVSEVRSLMLADETDAAYIAAASPDVMAKLIAVVRAAEDASALIDRISEGREWGAIEEYGTALRYALAALKGTP